MLQNKDFDHIKAVRSLLTLSNQPRYLGRIPGSIFNHLKPPLPFVDSTIYQSGDSKMLPGHDFDYRKAIRSLKDKIFLSISKYF